MSAIELRLKRLESVNQTQKGVACLLRKDDETDEACMVRQGYQGKVPSSFFVIDELDARL